MDLKINLNTKQRSLLDLNLKSNLKINYGTFVYKDGKTIFI